MSTNKCRNCGRELKDQTAMYGWRCAQKLGYSEGFIKLHAELWSTSGCRYVYEKAHQFLDEHGYDPDEVDLDGFYMAMVDIIIAEYNGDYRKWEQAYWDAVAALFPGYNAKGERTINTAGTMELNVLLDVIQWIDELDLNFPMSRLSQAESSGYSFLQTDGMPRYADSPIHPIRVEEYLLKRNEMASYHFWVDGLEIYDGKSRMETWTSPIHPDDMGGRPETQNQL